MGVFILLFALVDLIFSVFHIKEHNWANTRNTTKLTSFSLIFQTTAHHGTDPIAGGPTGNSIPGLPAATVCTPVSSHPHFHPPGPGGDVPGSGATSAPRDRNHNTMSGAGGGAHSGAHSGSHTGACQRPGCGNSVTKAADGTQSTYCSSECVVGQCRYSRLDSVGIIVTVHRSD